MQKNAMLYLQNCDQWIFFQKLIKLKKKKNSKTMHPAKKKKKKKKSQE